MLKPESEVIPKSLLPKSYDPNSNALPEIPIPEAHSSLYTKERLQKSLVYAEMCLQRRDISPRSELFMQLYKDEIKDALNTEAVEKRDHHVIMIIAEERLMQEKEFLRPFKSASTIEMGDQLLQLREFQYIARYGDYMKIIPNRLKIHASNTKFEDWELISGSVYWSKIADQLEEEEKKRKEATSKGLFQVTSAPVAYAIFKACYDLGISDDLAIWAIKEYAARNRGAHRDLIDLKKEGQYSLLAMILCADRNELFSTFSCIGSETDLTHLQNIIQGEIDTMFEDTVENPTNPSVWVPSPALRQIHRDAMQKAKQPIKDEIKKANIAKSQRESEEKAARQAEANQGASSSVSKKRIASTEEPRGSDRERQNKKHQQRVKLLAQISKLEEDLKRLNRELSLLDEDDDFSNNENIL